MIKAIDCFGVSITIDLAERGKTYYCPICKQALMQKRGNIREHHFSHIGIRDSSNRQYVSCSDKWHYDKTDWHIQWQKMFADECYEKVLEFEGKKHIADVLIGDIVIEFQHSNISIEEFRDRNEFYTKCGFKVIWIFDMIEECDNGKILLDERSENCYYWTYVKKLFREIELKNEKAIMFFQFSNEKENMDEATCIEKVSKSYNHFRKFYTDNDYWFTINDFIKKVKESPSWFFVKKTINKPTQEQIKSIELKGGNTIFELWEKNYSGMIVQNLFSNEEMLISGSDGEIYRSKNSHYAKIIGKYTKRNVDGSYYYSKYYNVWDADKPIWKKKRVFFESKKEINKIDGGKKLRELLQTIQQTCKILKCLLNNKTYILKFVNLQTFSFNAYRIDLDTGEINKNDSNEEVSKQADNAIWSLK